MYICSEYCDEVKLLLCAVTVLLDTAVLRPSMNHFSLPFYGIRASYSD